jgi:hypothetical protein
MSLHRQQTHPEFVEGCFGCKISTLSLNAGEANSNLTMSSKKWDKELQAYRDARAQGIQPAGTSMTKVQEAVKISNETGKAYGA